MVEKSKRKYEYKKKYNAVDELIKRNDICFRNSNAARIYKKDDNFVKLCEVLEGASDAEDNLFLLRLDYLRNPNGDERILKKFKDAHASQNGSNRYGPRPLPYLDRGLNACGLINTDGQLTKKGQKLIKAVSSSKQ